MLGIPERFGKGRARSMRIGIDLYHFDPECAGGVHTFALGLVGGLLGNLRQADSLVILVSERNAQQMQAALAHLPVSFVTVSTGGGYRYMNRILWYLSWALGNFRLRFWYDKYFRPALMNKIDASLDALVAPATVLNFFALRAPTVLCIHDIQQEYHPELFSFHQRILRWAPYRLSCWRAAAIQASSNYIKGCLLEKFRFIGPEKIFIAFEGVDLNKFSAGIPAKKPENMEALETGDFVFYPAQLWPHKNHEMLVEALAIFRDKTERELPCVLTGFDYGHWGRVQEKIRERQLGQVCYLGRVDFAELLWLYRNCKAVLALGLHESSSLPVREGAAFGRPLICSDIPPNIETSALLHLEIVDRHNPGDLARVFLELVQNGEVMRTQAAGNVDKVGRFSWDKIAQKYLAELYRLAQTK